MTVVLTDTLSGRRRGVPRPRGRPVGLYVCGPTVYNASHVGHARTYLFFDVLRRTLAADGYAVRHVMNVTDFEDKIDQRALDLGTSWRALARREERAFVSDLESLDILLPHERPRASEYVRRMVDVVRRLERTGRVRHQDDEWLYEAPARPPSENFSAASELASHAVAEAGLPRPDPATAREFMIWRRQDPPRASFPSPWGRGIPGWHLECFAMAERLLELPVELHGGGRDLIYPHHYAENEIAWALARRPITRSFVHTALVFQDGRKMAKSTGNLVPIRAAVAAVGAGALRWYLLGIGHSERLAWEAADLARARDEYERVRHTIADSLADGGAGRVPARAFSHLAGEVARDLGNDLATDRAVTRIRSFAAQLEARANGRVARGDRRRALAAVRDVERRLGFAIA